MQTSPPPAPHSWLDLVYVAATVFLTALFTKGKDWYKFLSERRTRKLLAAGENRRRDAETEHLRLTNDIEEGEAVVKAYKSLVEAQLKIGEQGVRILQLENDVKEKQGKIEAILLREKISTEELTQARHALGLHKIRYDGTKYSDGN